jgi:hypothetical protein
VDAALLARRRWSEDEAHAVLEDIELSGESVSEYGRRRGLDPQRLYRWKRITTAPKPQPIVALASEFLPVRVTPDVASVSSARPKPAFEVVLPGGRLVRVAEGFDATTLVRLLATLEDGT